MMTPTEHSAKKNDSAEPNATVNILGVHISQVTMAQALSRLHTFLRTDQSHLVITPNPEIVIKATKDPELLGIINTAELVVPDGIGVVIGARLLGQSLPERVAGYDLTRALFASTATLDQPLTVYLLGGKPGVAEQAKAKLELQYPNLSVVGTHSGFFDKSQELGIIEQIQKTKPQVLLLGLGAPKQEKWLHQHRHLPFRIGIGGGGQIDVFAGVVTRAPQLFIKLNLEWLYRILRQPKRIFRMGGLVSFVLRIVLQVIMNRK